MILYIDATGKYVAKQDEAKKAGKGWHQVDVPTTDGRQALAEYLNALRWSEQQIATINVINPMEGQPVDEPEHKPGYTAEQVDAMFKPRAEPVPLKRDKICEAIADMHGTDLGFVALEVAARFETLAKK